MGWPFSVTFIASLEFFLKNSILLPFAVHDFRKDEDTSPEDSDDEFESLLSSLSLHTSSNYNDKSPSKKKPLSQF